jgi:exodeoxyribonuclease V alpha subunit
MKTVAQRFQEAGYRVGACAPTGKAARRIREATSLDAVTIHKLLQYPHPNERNPKTGEALRQGYPQRDRYNPLELDVVLADEYAMVNHEIHGNLVDALPPGCVLRCFGDVNQLPPIERVKALEDQSPYQKLLKQFPSVVLETIHRQGEGSGIVAAGVDILRGRGPKRADDFKVVMTDDPVNKLIDAVMEAKEDGMDFGAVDHQIISPTKKSWVGTVKLNATLQQLLNEDMPNVVKLPRHSWAEDKDTRVAVGDKVIWTQNNYELEIMNGELGIITQITELEEIVIDFGERVKSIPPMLAVTKKDGTLAYVDPRKDIDLAYAVTTHKAQGSEFKRIIYVLNKSSVFMQNCANYYTAITRARNHVTLITDQKSFFASLQKPRNMKKKGLDQ